MDTKTPSTRADGLPLPLAGEGWGGGVSTKGLAMVDPEHPDWKISEKLRSNARALRRNSTDVERVLWLELRGNRLNGANFRRQVPIDNYIADFICHAAKRSAVIEAKGFKVLRFSNLDVIENRAGVLETTAAAIAERAPTLTLPRKRERGLEKPSS